MPENLLVVSAEGSETRVGHLENGVLAEYFLERKRERGIVGNIYRAKVTRVLPGMQAAFVDLGPSVERAGFLYVGDILGADNEKKLFDMDDSDGAADDAPEGTASRLARSRRRSSTRKIEEVLKANQQILVQVVKDPMGLKGARVTGYLSLPGRYGVLMPAVDHMGVSRRIAGEKERRRLRDVVAAVLPKGMGFIVRTAADGADSQEVRDDIGYLTRLWAEIGAREKRLKGPGLIYTDLDLVLRTVRDLLREDTKEIVIDSEEEYERATKFVNVFLPRKADRIKHYTGRQPIFDHYGVEAELRTALGRKVPLKSGGHLVIDQGEALTAIDVNTGSFVGKEDLESTVTANNLEASREIARQLRLRNIGGIIVLDFVDMDKHANRVKVWEAFNEALAADRSRCNVTKISELGLVEMTRKRTRESLMQLLNDPCPTCAGAATISSTTTVANSVLREVRRLGASVDAESIEVECSKSIADLILAHERGYLDELEKKFQKKVNIKVSGAVRPGEYKVAGRSSEADKAEPGRSRRGGRRGGSKRGAGKSSAGSNNAGGGGAKPSGSSADKQADRQGGAAVQRSVGGDSGA